VTFRLPSEIVVEEVLPTLRVELAHALAERGLTQQEVADELGITQAAVSKYVSGEATTVTSVADHPRTTTTVERVAEGLATGGMDGYDALAEVFDLVRAFEDRGPICELHEEAMPELRGLGCDLCVRGTDEQLRAERDSLADARKGARTLATTPWMADYVPNVGSNVGAALPGATDRADVAAIPGRVYAIGGRVEVPANPEFGASRNVAAVLLAATAVDSGVRGAVNLVTDEALLEAARARGVDPLEFEADYEDRGRRLRELFAGRGAVPRVIYHRGAFGIEPITYILGADAVDAARFATDLIADAREA